MKLLIRTGLALALGFGALAAAPRTAMAGPPCTRQCDDFGDYYTKCETKDTNCQATAQLTARPGTSTECLDCDGDCVSGKVDVTTSDYYCTVSCKGYTDAEGVRHSATLNGGPAIKKEYTALNSKCDTAPHLPPPAPPTFPDPAP